MLLCKPEGKERRKERQRRRQKSLYGFVVTAQYYKIVGGWWDLFCSQPLPLTFFCCKKPHSIQPFVLFRLQLVALFYCGEFFFSTRRQKKPNKPPPQKRPFLKRIFFGKKYKIKKGPKSPGFWGGKKKSEICRFKQNRFKHVTGLSCF